MSDDALTRRRTLPPGGLEAMRFMADGWEVRSFLWADGSRGSILAINGRGDYVEKYAEALHDWRARGYAVAAFDWRGQGGSGRLLPDRHKGHSPGFEVWLRDLVEQIAWFKASTPAPHYAVAHSMGGHLLLRHLTAGGRDFERSVLLAPMAGLLAVPIGAWVARRVAGVAVTLGFGDRYAPGSGPLVRGEPGSVRQLRLTHDVDRYADEAWWIEQNPALGVGGVTSGWLHDAFASVDALTAAGRLEAVRTPLLALMAGGESLVDNAATERAVARVPGARMQTYEGAGHELVREVDAIRLPVLDRIATFLS